MAKKALHKKPTITEDEYRAVLNGGAFTADEKEAIELMRQDLTKHGITTEPMRTRMACEFADVLLAMRRAK